MENSNVFKILRPQRPLPLVFDSPHSGRYYPPDFGHACPRDALIAAEDNYVDELFECVPAHGGILLCALFPRTYIDTNRAADDIDPALLDGDWPHSLQPTARSDAGFGLIRKLLKHSVPVYNRKLPVSEITQRIDKYYKPYHQTLGVLLDESARRFGQSWHINCHSMPGVKGRGPDFVIGDLDGTSCTPDLTHEIHSFIKGLGYSVTVNEPYKGAEILRRHGRPAHHRHSIQIEISKRLYWSEQKLEKSSNFKKIQTDIDRICANISAFVTNQLVSLAAD